MDNFSNDRGNELSVGMIVVICVVVFVVSKSIFFLIWYCWWKKIRSYCEVKL